MEAEAAKLIGAGLAGLVAADDAVAVVLPRIPGGRRLRPHHARGDELTRVLVEEVPVRLEVTDGQVGGGRADDAAHPAGRAAAA